METTPVQTGAGLVSAQEILAAMPLFQIEESLCLLADAAEEDGSNEDLDRALGEYMAAAIEKRDRVAAFLRYCEALAEAAKAEEERLAVRRKRFEQKLERLKGSVLRIMDALGYQKLEGRTSTLARRKCPPSVQVSDAGLVPDTFKRQLILLPRQAWLEALAALPPDIRERLLTGILKQETNIEAGPLKSALQQGKEIEGAAIAAPRYYLHIS